MHWDCLKLCFGFFCSAFFQCTSGAALARLITIEIGGEASERMKHAIRQSQQLAVLLLLQLQMPLLLLLLWMSQLSQHFGMLHIGDANIDRLIVIAIATTAVHILVVGEPRRGQLDNRWRHCQRCRGLYVGIIRRWCMSIAWLDAQLLLVVVFLEIALQASWQLQLIDAIVCGIRDDCGTRQLLQRERLTAMQRHG